MSMDNAKEAKVNGLFLFKEGMTTVYGKNGEAIPVTVLRYEDCFVTQVKTVANDGYDAVQLGCGAKKEKNTNKSEKGHFSKAIEVVPQFVKEIKGVDVAQLSLGDKVSIESISEGDVVSITSTSKGKGFAGVVRRYKFAGGPASHGSKFHRRPGSSGNRTWPGRVMPGKKFPGHLGSDTITVKNVEVIKVMPQEKVIMIKGPVPGSKNTVVKMVRG